MAASQGKALDALGQRQARRSEAQNRAIVSGRLPGIRAARSRGHGFRTISRAIFEDDGIRTSEQTLKWHYSRLIAAVPPLEIGKTQPIPVAPDETPAPTSEAQAEDNDFGFEMGGEYELHSQDHGREIMMTVFFKGIRDGKYVFDRLHKNGNITTKEISPASMRYYGVTRK